MTVEQLDAYELIEKREIEDIHSLSYVLRHKKSGAKIALLSNDDKIKCFILVSGHRQKTVQVWHIFWNIQYFAVLKSIR